MTFTTTVIVPQSMAVVNTQIHFLQLKAGEQSGQGGAQEKAQEDEQHEVQGIGGVAEPFGHPPVLVGLAGDQRQGEPHHALQAEEGAQH